FPAWERVRPPHPLRRRRERVGRLGLLSGRAPSLGRACKRRQTSSPGPSGNGASTKSRERRAGACDEPDVGPPPGAMSIAGLLIVGDPVVVPVDHARGGGGD